MDNDLGFAPAVVDNINGFSDLKCAAMWAAIVADDERIHPILALYDTLYTDRDREMWCFDKSGKRDPVRGKFCFFTFFTLRQKITMGATPRLEAPSSGIDTAMR
jgi:hypothetical protein